MRDRITALATMAAIPITALAIILAAPFVPTGDPLQAQLSKRADVTAAEHTLLVFRPELDLPDGHELFGIHWRLGDLNAELFEQDTAAAATGEPGSYVVEFWASHAKVKTDADGDKVLLFPPTSVSQTWLVTISGDVRPNPPPKDPEKPKEGQAAAAIIYDANQGAPLAGEGATNELRKQGLPVFFLSAATEAGDGGPPAFLAAAIEAAKANGLPALVLMRGEAAEMTLDLPADKADIVSAVVRHAQ